MKHSLPKILFYTLLLVLINSIQGCGINTDLEEPTSIAPEEERILTKNPTPNSKGHATIPSHQPTKEDSHDTKQQSLKTPSDSSTAPTGDSTQNGGGTQENSHNTNSSTASTRNSMQNGRENSVVPQV